MSVTVYKEYLETISAVLITDKYIFARKRSTPSTEIVDCFAQPVSSDPRFRYVVLCLRESETTSRVYTVETCLTAALLSDAISTQ